MADCSQRSHTSATQVAMPAFILDKPFKRTPDEALKAGSPMAATCGETIDAHISTSRSSKPIGWIVILRPPVTKTYVAFPSNASGPPRQTIATNSSHKAKESESHGLPDRSVHPMLQEATASNALAAREANASQGHAKVL